MTAAKNRPCIITLRLSDFKSEESLIECVRHNELTNETVSYFLIKQSKTIIDLKVTTKPVRLVKSLNRAHLTFLLILIR